MSKVEVKVQLETITPLWTGDAWMENYEIRPSSLIGSLRFWFEVICYFGGICPAKDFDKEKGRVEKDIKNESIRKELLKHGTDFDGQISALKDLKIPIPAIIFGTTGLKSLIEINGIRYLNDYCFGNKLNLLSKFCISKNENNEVKENNECPRRSNNDWSVFYFKIPYFWGKFEVVFRVPKEIKETIFFPLLSFMDKYGYWGGGWNIGYGRLRINRVKIETEVNNVKEVSNWRKDEFDFPKFDKLENNSSVKYDDLIKTVNFYELIDKNIDEITKTFLYQKIKKIQVKNCNKDIKEVIKELIEKKAELRKKHKLNPQSEDEKRHEIFGYSKPTEGSKILPYINRLDNNSYECGFLSIAGILSLY
jgi:CRISPR-associated protein Cmr1